MEAYSGTWTLDPTQSEDLGQEMRRAMEGNRGGMPGGIGGGGGRTGGGGMGGRPGGGGMRSGGGMGGMGAETMDPEAMERMMRAMESISRTPERLSLNLQPESVTLTQDDTQVLVLVLNGEEEAIQVGDVTLAGKARWTSNGIEIHRLGQRGQGVRDRFQVNAEGNLVLKREISLMAQIVRGTLVYVKDPDSP